MTGLPTPLLAVNFKAKVPVLVVFPLRFPVAGSKVPPLGQLARDGQCGGRTAAGSHLERPRDPLQETHRSRTHESRSSRRGFKLRGIHLAGKVTGEVTGLVGSKLTLTNQVVSLLPPSFELGLKIVVVPTAPVLTTANSDVSTPLTDSLKTTL